MMNKQKIISLTLAGAIGLGSCVPAMAMQASDAPVGGSSFGSSQISEKGNIATLKARYEEAKRNCDLAEEKYKKVIVPEEEWENLFYRNEAYPKVKRVYYESKQELDVMKKSLEEKRNRMFEESKKAAVTATQAASSYFKEVAAYSDAGMVLEGAIRALKTVEEELEKGINREFEKEKAKFTVDNMQCWPLEARGAMQEQIEKAVAAKAEFINKEEAYKKAKEICDIIEGNVGEEEAKRKCKQAEAEYEKSFEVLLEALKETYQRTKQVYDAAKQEFDASIVALRAAEKTYKEAQAAEIE